MGTMTTLHAPDRCVPRATRIAQVKFVMLPADPAVETAAGAVEAAAGAVAPVQTGAQSLSCTLRSFLLRVIGCLEAARP